jgi:hypothetical protein
MRVCVFDKGILVTSSTALMPYHNSMAYAELTDGSDGFAKRASRSFTALFTADELHKQPVLASNSVYVSGVSASCYNMAVLTRCSTRPKKITVPLQNELMWNIIHDLLRLETLERAQRRSGKKHDSQVGLYGEVPEAGAEYHNHSITVSTEWLLNTAAKHGYAGSSDECHMRPDFHNKSAMAVYSAERFLRHHETKNMAHFLSLKSEE